MQCKICGYINSFTIRGEDGKCYQCGAPIRNDDEGLSTSYKIKKSNSFNSATLSVGLMNDVNNTEEINDIYKWFRNV